MVSNKVNFLGNLNGEGRRKPQMLFLFAAVTIVERILDSGLRGVSWPRKISIIYISRYTP